MILKILTFPFRYGAKVFSKCPFGPSVKYYSIFLFEFYTRLIYSVDILDFYFRITLVNLNSQALATVFYINGISLRNWLTLGRGNILQDTTIFDAARENFLNSNFLMFGKGLF